MTEMTLDQAIAVEVARRQKEHAESLVNLKARLEGTHFARQALVAAGFPVKAPTYAGDFGYIFLKVDRHELTAVRHALGVPLRFTGSDLEDADAQTARRSFRPQGFDGVYVECVVQLTAESKCRVVYESRPMLVCGKR